MALSTRSLKGYCTLLAISFILLFYFAESIFGADFYKSKKEIVSEKLNVYTTNLLIYGDIETGDAQRFAGIVQKINQDVCLVGKISLLSNGGNVFEAMEIGSIIRKKLISTEAPKYEDSLFYKERHEELGVDFHLSCRSIINSFPNAKPCMWKNTNRNTKSLSFGNPEICGCNSACFLIWASGVIRLGDGIGIHRPYFSPSYFQNLPAKEAKEKYNEMSKKVKDYLISMDIPNQIIETMFNHSSEDIYFFAKNYERREWGGIPALTWVPFFEEWIISKCGLNLSIEESDLLRKLSIKDPKDLTTLEKYALDGLKTKYQNRSECFSRAKMDVQLRGVQCDGAMGDHDPTP